MADKKKGRIQRLAAFLRLKYRLILLNDTSFAEKFSIRLSPLNLLIGILALTILMTTGVISLVAFTSLREYIPGYGTINERRQIIKLNNQADSLEKVLASRDLYLKGLLTVFGEGSENMSPRPVRDSSGKYRKLNVKPTESDLSFRKEYENTAQKPAKGKTQANMGMLQDMVFFAPVKGLITKSYNPAEPHFGTDIATREDELVKSTLDGTIIYKGFTAEDGNIVEVQHANNVTSIYKHCSTVLKETGDKVKSGEAIAVVGNTGENSKGAHLHFELWFNGISVNPQDYVAF
ncbi:MAG TPA: M23 family metallopeptidase [Bacteroidia bacterium]|nr:M23 family metallopeptidase [Bacteroidia bacterium]